MLNITENGVESQRGCNSRLHHPASSIKGRRKENIFLPVPNLFIDFYYWDHLVKRGGMVDRFS
jgi:hypothetical protein